MSSSTPRPAQRVLIVEDNTGLRRMLVWALEDRGYEVVGAANCREAQEALRGNRFDLALLDVQLPDGDGIRLMGELLSRQPGMRAFVTSGPGRHDTARRAVRAGARKFFPKPLSVGALDQVFQQGLPRQAG